MATTEMLKDFESRALVVEKAGDDFKMRDIVLDEVREDELLVEMAYTGLCHTDIVLAKGLLPLVEFPAIFGHEGAGYIKAIGNGVENKSLHVGDTVLLSFNTCGTCKQCEIGHPAYCHTHPQVNHNAVRTEDRSTPARLKSDNTPVRSQYFGHSSFAKHSIVKQKCVVKCEYPDALSYYAAMGCGFQTGAGTVLNVLKPQLKDSVVIFGMGSVGIAALLAAKFLGVEKIVAVDIRASKLKLATDLGATDTIDSSSADQDVVAVIKKVCDRTSGANFSIDCTGISKVIEHCIECLAPCGTAASVGVPPVDSKISIDPLTFLLENKRYIGVIEGDSVPQKFIPQLIQMHQDGKFPVDKICKIFPIEDYEKAIHEMEEGNIIKPVLKW